MAKLSHEIWRINDIDIPVRIYRERRNNNRISIAKDGVNIRISIWSISLGSPNYKRWAYDWLLVQFENNPVLLERFKTRIYENGDLIQTHFHRYELIIQKSVRKTSSARLKGDRLFIKLNIELSPPEQSKTIKALVARSIAKREQPRVAERIQEINQTYFNNLPISDVRIKNNSSNWGSCSVKGNINISVRTLFAPAQVQDYIFIHELAHRIEMNHSHRYWAIVEKVMPEYKRAEAWLKDHGKECEV